MKKKIKISQKISIRKRIYRVYISMFLVFSLTLLNMPNVAFAQEDTVVETITSQVNVETLADTQADQHTAIEPAPQPVVEAKQEPEPVVEEKQEPEPVVEEKQEPDQTNEPKAKAAFETKAETPLKSSFELQVEQPQNEDSQEESIFTFGRGSEFDPLQIKTIKQFKEMAEAVNQGRLANMAGQNLVFIKLMNDISLNKTEEWNPIGTASNPFSGRFDGNKHSVSGVKIDQPNKDNVGFFGYVYGGTIKDLGLIDVDIKGRNNVGGLAGISDKESSITSIYVTGKVDGESFVGGVVGANQDQSIVKNVYSTADVTGTDYFVGGVAGHNFSSTITNVYSTGTVKGDDQVGGVVGLSEKDFSNTQGSKISNTAALNDKVTGTTNVGRVLGLKGSSSILSNNIAYEGLVGVSQSYDGLDYEDGAAKTADQIKSEGFFENLFGNDKAWIYEQDKLPVLRGITGQRRDTGSHITGEKKPIDPSDPETKPTPGPTEPQPTPGPTEPQPTPGPTEPQTTPDPTEPQPTNEPKITNDSLQNRLLDNFKRNNQQSELNNGDDKQTNDSQNKKETVQVTINVTQRKDKNAKATTIITKQMVQQHIEKEKQLKNIGNKEYCVQLTIKVKDENMQELDVTVEREAIKYMLDQDCFRKLVVENESTRLTFNKSDLNKIVDQTEGNVHFTKQSTEIFGAGYVEQITQN